MAARAFYRRRPASRRDLRAAAIPADDLEALKASTVLSGDHAIYIS